VAILRPVKEVEFEEMLEKNEQRLVEIYAEALARPEAAIPHHYSKPRPIDRTSFYADWKGSRFRTIRKRGGDLPVFDRCHKSSPKTF
jgi:hypothetical protein